MSTKRTRKSYDSEFKAQAVKLAQEIGGHKAAKELGVPDGTIYCWIKAFKEGRLSANEAVHIQCFVVQSFTVTGAHSIQAKYTVKQSINMAFTKA